MFFKKNKNKENITTSNEYEKAKKEMIVVLGEMVQVVGLEKKL
jgi:hypothetical protein